MKKRMNRNKQPVLTSPWKIGTFVSLLLVLMSLGVSCYLVSFYNVSLKWITTGAGGWKVDSYLFFKEIYPLAAGVILISLFAYFLIASAVRRYKFYLDSGQDYRKMISLAKSVDDLTNPAQIARLSSFPELQAVLRNYGDQIREISQDLAQHENTVDFDELEGEIDGVLRGKSAGEGALGGKKYVSICGKIKDHLQTIRAHGAEIEKRSESERMVIGRAALAYGRAVEAISGAGEELLAITSAVSELAKVANAMSGARNAASGPVAGSQAKAFKAIVVDMESSVRKLEDGGHVLQEFSEENNGIAINLALMAARGHVDEHDLATFAERVRSTAERFHKLSGTVSSIAQGLLGSCYAFKEKTGELFPARESVDHELHRSIVEIARSINERSNLLQKRICRLGSELHEAHELLQKDFTGADVPFSSSVEGAPSRREAVNLGGAPAADEASEIVIDHGKAWAGMGAGEEKIEMTDHHEESHSSKNMEESKVASAFRDSESDTGAQKSDFSDMSSLRELDNAAAPDDGLLAEKGQSPQGESWMEMPGHRWLKIDVEKSEPEDEPGSVAVTVEPPSRERSEEKAAPTRAEAQPRSDTEPAIETTDGADALFGTKRSDDDERIFDLFELGAVEYVEEVQARR